MPFRVSDGNPPAEIRWLVDAVDAIIHVLTKREEDQIHLCRRRGGLCGCPTTGDIVRFQSVALYEKRFPCLHVFLYLSIILECIG